MTREYQLTVSGGANAEFSGNLGTLILAAFGTWTWRGRHRRATNSSASLNGNALALLSTALRRSQTSQKKVGTCTYLTN